MLILSELLSPEMAEDFAEHRRSKRAKLTAKAAELIVRKLRDHPNPDAEIERTIMQGWTGVFPENRQSQPAPQKSITQSVLDEFLIKDRSQ
ncbi:hypothetical protein [Ketogulonicigenium robustum]|nr:hypothetical protein [Ketogulonicigenium robustum]